MHSKIVQSTIKHILLTGLLGTAVTVFAATPSTAKHEATQAKTIETKSAQPLVNRIKWRTAREFRNFGYDVYRSNSEKGPFTKVTPEIILGHGTTDTVHSYQFEDRQVKSCVAYYYYIENISEDGERKRYSSTQKAPVKDSAGNKVLDHAACKPQYNE